VKYGVTGFLQTTEILSQKKETHLNNFPALKSILVFKLINCCGVSQRI